MQNQDTLIKQCLSGDNKALEELIKHIQGQIYNLSVRFYWNPADAEDATQEILIKIITHLAAFKGQSAFETWSYRLATNYLLNSKRRKAETLTFEIGEFHLREGLKHEDYNAADKDLLAEEVKIGCTTSMLSCLSRPTRLAYILGDIFEFNSTEGAFMLDIEPDTFRKRLATARKKIRKFMKDNCGIYHTENPCRCSKQINYDIHIHRIHPQKLLFADKTLVQQTLKEVEEMGNDIAIFQRHPTYAAPQTILENIRKLINNGKYAILTH